MFAIFFEKKVLTLQYALKMELDDQNPGWKACCLQILVFAVFRTGLKSCQKRSVDWESVPRSPFACEAFINIAVDTSDK